MGDSSLKLPFEQSGLSVVSSGLNLILRIPKLQVVVMFGVTGFSVNLPFQHFGNNTQGHCGMEIKMQLFYNKTTILLNLLSPQS